MTPAAASLLERLAGARWGAEFNAARDHRLLAWRRRGTEQPLLGVGMLNPSRGDERANDQTFSVLLERTRLLAYEAS